MDIDAIIQEVARMNVIKEINARLWKIKNKCDDIPKDQFVNICSSMEDIYKLLSEIVTLRNHI